MRGWGLDDWMRPARWTSGTWRARPPTLRDRRWAQATLLVAVVLLAAVVVLVDRPRFFQYGFPLYLASFAVIDLWRTRHLTRRE